MPTPTDILAYEGAFPKSDQAICEALRHEIESGLPEATSKVWHAHPVWFLDGNPIVGYSREKRGMRLMFWSGADFEEDGLNVRGGKFKDASKFYQDLSEIDRDMLSRWLVKSRDIQWDYANIVKRKGKLERLR
jgi:Domain of unknown function (DU1801)